MLKIPDQKLKTLLIQEGVVKEEVFDDLLAQAKRAGRNVGEFLISFGYVTEDYLYDIFTKYLGLERADLSLRAIDESVLRLITEELARQRRVIPFSRDKDGTISVAMEDPTNLETVQFLSQRLQAKIRPFLATNEDLNRGFVLYGRQSTKDFESIIKESVRATLVKKIGGTEEETAKEAPIVRIVDNILSYAFSLGASDIHMEILESVMIIRYRVDGILREITRIPTEIYLPILARVKLLGQMKIDEHYKPQDGRFRYQMGSEFFDIRVAIIPVLYGEKIELRLLPATQKPLSFDELGMLDDTKAIVEENIKKSYGMVLVCGPTGSGKTTTLYAILNVLNTPDVNVVTIEDPIEYGIRYVNQTQVNEQQGITFANGLRAILRQDPNIIMVGEMRDRDTAEIGVQSALTGHLLLSSLHTNDSPTAVPRLMDMGIQPFLIAAVLNVVISQRLVRKICTQCIESYVPSPAVISSVEEQLKLVNPSSSMKVVKQMYRGKGCDACNGKGFAGRLAIFEAFNVTEDIRQHIIDRNFSLDGLRKLAQKDGMISMFEDGLRKVERGITTIEEVMRVIRE